jgi:WD40 repeat protein
VTDRTNPTRLGQPLTGHTDQVYTVAFAPDGKALATAGADKTAILWDLDALNDLRGHAAQRACGAVERGLDSEEWHRYIPDLPYQKTCP